ncbi:MAG: FG-GAP-like repeat-containing protein, partial [Nostoc sp.]|uniref:calcium-binding protein n=1 Tax=Nostoc sp. TaxID=1180 RepID=UPI002FFD3A89
QVADVNGDGLADIIGFGQDAVFVSLGQSNGTFSSEVVVANNSFNVNGGGWTSFDRFPRKVADVNGDGRADIIGFGQDAVFVSLGQSNNTINGGSGNDILNGGSGNDTINGGSGNDTLNGGAGSDTFKGSQGNDSINGGDGIDTADYSQLGQSITLSGVGTIKKAGGLGQDQLFKVEKIIANANVANNTIDTSQSLPGVFISVNLQTQSLAVNNIPGLGTLPFTVVNFDNVIGTNANDSIIGDNQNNQLSGGNGNDTINGGSGNDRLIGGSGTDLLTGGSGNDIFDFNSVSESKPGVLRDVINDFVGNGNLSGDQIDLFNIDANSGTLSVNDAFTFIGANPFTAPAQVRYVGGILQGNINGNLAADFEIRLAGAPQLVASDIIL